MDVNSTKDVLANMVKALDLFSDVQRLASDKVWKEINEETNWYGAPTWNEVSQMRDALKDHLEKIEHE